MWSIAFMAMALFQNPVSKLLPSSQDHFWAYGGQLTLTNPWDQAQTRMTLQLQLHCNLVNFDSLKESTHESHSFRNQTSLVAVCVFDSIIINKKNCHENHSLLNQTSMVAVFVFDLLKEPAHESHLLENQTSLVALHVFDSLKKKLS